ncbi:FkbM family methyltransferase [Bradyrhizobium sp. GM5.1]
MTLFFHRSRLSEATNVPLEQAQASAITIHTRSVTEPMLDPGFEKALKAATVETRYGAMHVPLVEDNTVVRFLKVYGEWAELEVDFVARNVRENARVADVGAFLGTFGIGLSQRVRLSSICFVEANAGIVPLLESNAANNCRAESRIVSAVVSPDGYSALLAYRHPGNEGSVSFIARAGAEPAPDIPVSEARISLRDLWKKCGPFDLLKLDIEGMELPALLEVQDILAEKRVTVWAECNEEPGAIDTAEFLLSCGLRVFYFAFPSHNPDNYKGERSPIYPYAYEAGLYASASEPQMPHSLIQQGCLFGEIRNGEALREALWHTPRWCPPDIVQDRPEESLAVALHRLNGVHYESFLTGKSEKKPEHRASDAEPRDFVAARTAERDAAIARLKETDTALGEAQVLVATRTAERDVATTQARELAAALAKAEALVEARTQERDGLAGTVALAELAAAKRGIELENLGGRVEKLEAELIAAGANARWVADISHDRLILLRAYHRSGRAIGVLRALFSLSKQLRRGLRSYLRGIARRSRVQ